jgi:hypothetical protein
MNIHILRKNKLDNQLTLFDPQRQEYWSLKDMIDEVIRIIFFLQQQIKIQQSKQDDIKNLVNSNHSFISKKSVDYSPEIISLFLGQTEIIDLMYYLNDNYDHEDGRFTTITKFNQIYFFLKEILNTSNFNQRVYVDFVKNTFDPTYNPSRINGKSDTHQRFLGVIT